MGPCPVCGAPLRGRADLTEGEHRLSAFHCPRCGRFSCDADVLGRLAAATDGDREAVSLLVQIRAEDRSRGTWLRREDLPAALRG